MSAGLHVISMVLWCSCNSVSPSNVSNNDFNYEGNHPLAVLCSLPVCFTSFFPSSSSLTSSNPACPDSCQHLPLQLSLLVSVRAKSGSKEVGCTRTQQVFSMPQYTEDVMWPRQNQSDFHSTPTGFGDAWLLPDVFSSSQR